MWVPAPWISTKQPCSFVLRQFHQISGTASSKTTSHGITLALQIREAVLVDVDLCMSVQSWFMLSKSCCVPVTEAPNRFPNGCFLFVACLRQLHLWDWRLLQYLDTQLLGTLLLSWRVFVAKYFQPSCTSLWLRKVAS